MRQKYISYQQFRDSLRPHRAFSLSDARKIFPQFDRKRLTQWQSKGYLTQVVREHYYFTDVKQDNAFFWLLANEIYRPSYVSLETALGFYGFIPEAVFQITSISTRTSRLFSGNNLSLRYRNIKPSAFFGYRLMPTEDRHICFAEPEKALLDYLYLHPHMKAPDDFEAMRFNSSALLSSLDFSKLEIYARHMGNVAMESRLHTFIDWLHAAD